MIPKIVWVEQVDEYKLQVVPNEGEYTEPVYFAQALQYSVEGAGWYEVRGTQFVATEEEAREAIRKAWNV